MNKKSFKTLEFDKVLSLLSEFADNAETKERIISLVPAESASKAGELLSETTEAVGVLLRRGNIQSLKIKDVSAAVMRGAIGGSLTLGELLSVRDIITVSGSLTKYISEDKALPVSGRLSFIFGIIPLNEVKNRIDDVVISEEEIADSASAELFNIRRKIKNSNQKIHDMLNSMISSVKYQKALQEPIITTRDGRYVVPVKAECRNEIPGIVHDSSASGATIFVEPAAVVEMTNALSELFRQEKSEVERIITELSGYVGEFCEEIKGNINIIFDADFIFAKAKFSIKHNAVMPKLNDRGYINIIKGRHPLLDSDKVVPIDIILGGDFDTLVITGPNTGGKTVSLKTLGLFTLMALSGLHINAAETSEISFFKDVFADIGDEQSIEQSLSTFSSHMVNIVDILKNADDKSLVLADELGAGTDPTEGAALAIAIIENLRQRGVHFAATTHYSELKIYALSTPGVENASCEFDIKTLSPTYKLLIGVPGKSNAFAISKRLGLGDEIINRAAELMHEDNVKLEDVITRLEENSQRAQYKRSEAEAMYRDAKKYMKKVKKEQRELEEKSAKIAENARLEALRIIESAKEESAKIIKELHKIKERADIKDALKTAQESRDRLTESAEKISGSKKEVKKNIKPPKNLKVGETVKIISLDNDAYVLTAPDENGDLTVQAGIMKVKVNIKDLRRTEIKQEQNQAKRNVGTAVVSKTKEVKTEVDVRGMTLDEAILAVDKFIDDSIMASLTTVTIIHGKGTGVLRSGISDYLRRHRNVESFRPGKYGEGEYGVTVVTLK